MPRVVAQPTPNPHSLKFTADEGTFLASGLRAYHSAREAEGDALGAALFAVRGIEGLLIVPGFVTVTKHPAADWNLVAPAVEQILADYLAGAA